MPFQQGYPPPQQPQQPYGYPQQGYPPQQARYPPPQQQQGYPPQQGYNRGSYSQPPQQPAYSQPYGSRPQSYNYSQQPAYSQPQQPYSQPYGATTQQPYGSTAQQPYGSTSQPYGSTSQPYTSQPYTSQPYTSQPYGTSQPQQQQRSSGYYPSYAPAPQRRQSIRFQSMDQLAERAHLSAAQLQNLRAHFDYVDRDKSGLLDRNELAALLKNALNKQPDMRTIDWMLAIFDTDRSGKLSFEEFALGFGSFEYEIKLVRQHNLDMNLYYKLRQHFISFDTNRSGELGFADVRRFLSLGSEVSDATLKQFFDQMDTDGSGELSFAEMIPFLANLYGAHPEQQKNVTVGEYGEPAPAQSTAVATSQAPPTPMGEYGQNSSNRNSVAVPATQSAPAQTPTTPQVPATPTAGEYGQPVNASAPPKVVNASAPKVVNASAAPTTTNTSTNEPAPTSNNQQYGGSGTNASIQDSNASTERKGDYNQPVEEVPETKSGYLEEKGTFSWTKFFAKLLGDRIFLYKTAGHRNPDHSIVMNDRHDRTPFEPFQTGETTFEITSEKKKYLFRAESPGELDQWLKIIRARQQASYDEYRSQWR